MKKDNKKALYENIMTSVAKEVKKALNEAFISDGNGGWRDETEEEKERWMENYIRKEEDYRRNNKGKFKIGDCVIIKKCSTKNFPIGVKGHVTDIVEDAGRPLYIVTFFNCNPVSDMLGKSRGTEPDFWNFRSWELEKVY